MDKPKLRINLIAKCTHHDFRIVGNERIGGCTCKKCGQVIPLFEAFNRLIVRVQTTITKLEKARKGG
jgi:translation initiation factor 2 beta subunit (eIF-2beta)/eIF-5